MPRRHRVGITTQAIFTHPEVIVGASLDDAREIAALGTYVEHSLAFFLDGSKFQTRRQEDLKTHIDAVGFERTILCSDLGQVGTLGPLDQRRTRHRTERLNLPTRRKPKVATSPKPTRSRIRPGRSGRLVRSPGPASDQECVATTSPAGDER